MNFETIEYLKIGTPKQVKAYALLAKYQLMATLAKYEPLLVGTIPINIDIQTSDLDIICYWQSKEEFKAFVITHFATCSGFKTWENYELNAVVANFMIEDFEIEIFGQNTPTKEQFAYKHLVIENEILQVVGEDFRQNIITLKKQGFKTEPAFAHLLKLEGNPYEALLTFRIDSLRKKNDREG